MGMQLSKVAELVREQMKKPMADDVVKAWLQPGSAVTGLNAYDLQAPALKLYPVITPLRNRTPRRGGGKGTAHNWRAITGININQLEVGVSEGNRGGVIATTVTSLTQSYAGLGLEDYVTFEADYAGEGFDDVKARAVEGLLRSLMIGEEKVILGGNQTLALGTPATPVLTPSNTGGVLTNAASPYSVIVFALTMSGWSTASVAGGIRGVVTRASAGPYNNTDTYGGGASARSAAAAATIASGSTGSIAAVVTPVAGAFAYAWFWGVAGSETLGAITTINSALLTGNATGSQLASATSLNGDNSRNALVFDGYLTQIAKSGNNAIVITQPSGTAGTGTPLTADNAGGITEFDAMLKQMWDTSKVSPNVIYVSSQEQANLKKKILTASSTAAQRFVFNVSQNTITGGGVAMSYLNQYGLSDSDTQDDGSPIAMEIPIRIHPNLPSGTVLFLTDRLPYKLSNVTSPTEIITRREYYQLEWPLVKRAYEYGVYCDELMAMYFPPAYGIITNIGNG